MISCWSIDKDPKLQKSAREDKELFVRLVRLSYYPGAEVTDADALYPEKLNNETRDEGLIRALQDLDDTLFSW